MERKAAYFRDGILSEVSRAIAQGGDKTGFIQEDSKSIHEA